MENPGWKSTDIPRSFLHRKTCEVEDMLRPRLPTVCALTGSPLTARQIMHIRVEHPKKGRHRPGLASWAWGLKRLEGLNLTRVQGFRVLGLSMRLPVLPPPYTSSPPFRSLSRTSSYKPSIWRGISTLIPVCSKTDAFRHSTLTPCPFLLKYAAAGQNTFRSRLSKRAP